MAAEPPLNRLVLAAASVADDLGFVALADLSHVLAPDPDVAYRVIGGHMVTALVHRWQLGPALYRETGDADLGVPPIVVRDASLIERLSDLGYERAAGNRFARTVRDVPVHLKHDPDVALAAIIDILIPSYTSRRRANRRVGHHLVTTEVPGLATALRREPVTVSFELHRLNGDTLDVKLAFPDEVAALVLKGFASVVRARPTDLVDVWRCLEVANAAGVNAAQFSQKEPAEGAAIVRSSFAERDGPGMIALVGEKRLSADAADQRFTRIRGLIARVLGAA